MPNISRIKDNQTMKLCQAIEYNVKIFFFKYHAENMGDGNSSQTYFCFSKKVLFEVKASAKHLSYNIIYFGVTRLAYTIKANWIKFKTVDPEYAQF